MNNPIFNIKPWLSITFLGILLSGMLFTSCEEETKVGPITINKVYLEDPESTVPDREVSFVRLGQLLRIEGSGFTGLKRVYINGYSCYFNTAMVTDNSMLVSVSADAPIVDADPAVRNTLRLTNDGHEAVYNLEVRAAAPRITYVSNTLALEGETITVMGEGLLEVSKVVFPGNVEVTTDIVSDPDGEFFTVVVPAGVSADGGALLIECANGGAYSAANFNFVKGIILNFDGTGAQGFWGSSASMIQDVDLDSAVIGTGIVSRGKYVAHRPARIDTIKGGSIRNTEVWTAGNGADDWRGTLTGLIPATTPVQEVGFQFDMYVPEDWAGTGYLKICLVNGFNGGEWAGQSYNFVPWLNQDNEVVSAKTEGWQTVTIPFSEFYAFADGDFTFEDVLVARETANYKNFGMYFENNDFTLDKVTGNSGDSGIEFPSSATTAKVYTDNWRVVPITKPVYQDFPDEAAAE